MLLGMLKRSAEDIIYICNMWPAFGFCVENGELSSFREKILAQSVKQDNVLYFLSLKQYLVQKLYKTEI